jgi:hypothetical protein
MSFCGEKNYRPEVVNEANAGWPAGRGTVTTEEDWPDDWDWDAPNPEYDAYLDALPAGPEPQPEEPCGQAFPDDVPPPF